MKIDIQKVRRPVAESTLGVQVGGTNFGCAVMVIARKPMEFYEVRREFASCNQRLNTTEEQVAMRLRDNPYSSPRRVRQNTCQLYLRLWM